MPEARPNEIFEEQQVIAPRLVGEPKLDDVVKGDEVNDLIAFLRFSGSSI